MMDEAGVKGAVGWGYTNRPNTECAVPCCVSRRAGCCSLLYWYAPYGAANRYNQSIFHRDCCGWHTDVGTVDNVLVRYRHRPSVLAEACRYSCTAVSVLCSLVLIFHGIHIHADCDIDCEDEKHIIVETEDGTEIGRIIKYKYWLPPCHDRVLIEALTNNRQSRFTIWQHGWSCERVRQKKKKECMHIHCCGWKEHDTPVQGPREQGPGSDFVTATMTERVHALERCHGMWVGYRSWPAGATSTDKALLIGMTHAVIPIME